MRFSSGDLRSRSSDSAGPYPQAVRACWWKGARGESSYVRRRGAGPAPPRRLSRSPGCTALAVPGQPAGPGGGGAAASAEPPLPGGGGAGAGAAGAGRQEPLSAPPAAGRTENGGDIRRAGGAARGRGAGSSSSALLSCLCRSRGREVKDGRCRGGGVKGSASQAEVKMIRLSLLVNGGDEMLNPVLGVRGGRHPPGVCGAWCAQWLRFVQWPAATVLSSVQGSCAAESSASSVAGTPLRLVPSWVEVIKRTGSFEMSAVSVPPSSCAAPEVLCALLRHLSLWPEGYPCLTSSSLLISTLGPGWLPIGFLLLSCQVLRRWPPQVLQGPA